MTLLNTTAAANDLAEAVRQNIRVGMARRGLNQSDLAEALGVAPTYVSRRLNGTARLDVSDLAVFAAALEVTPLELVTPGGVS